MDKEKNGRNPYIKSTLSKHVHAEICERAQRLGTTPAQYLAAVSELWYGQGSPPVSDAEKRLIEDSR